MGHLFLSYSVTDQLAASELLRILTEQGHRVFLASDGNRPGDDWKDTLFHQLRICDAIVFLNSGKAQDSKWCHTELAIAQNLHKRVYSIAVEPGVEEYDIVNTLQAIKFAIDIPTTFQGLVLRLQVDGIADRLVPAWDRTRPPYVGLEPLDIADASIFFGRDQELKALMQRVIVPGEREGRIVIVTGPSGAGKSSLVRAGLAARLAHPPSSWLVADPFEPTGRPLDQLVTSLATLAHIDRAECHQQLTAGDDGLAAFAARLVDTDHRRLLIVVDQAEQLVGVAADDFMHILASLERNTPVTVVMTVRSDRLDQLIETLPTPLKHRIDDPVFIGPIRRSELPEVIAGPAAEADITLGAGLTAALVSDTALGTRNDTVDALPLLASALRDMWETAVVVGGRREITRADYDSLGGIRGAIRQRADTAEAAINHDHQPLLDNLLRRFLTLDRDRLPASRPLALSALSPSERAIIENLRSQRLVTTTGDTVRLAHETLLTAWPRLAAIAAQSQEDLLQQDRLANQAENWETLKGPFLSREAAAEAAAWANRQGRPDDTDLIQRYARASLRAATTRRRKAQVAITISTALALVAAIAAGIAFHSNGHARQEARIAKDNGAQAESIAIADQATKLLATNIPIGTLMSIAAYQTAPTPLAANALALAASKPLTETVVFGPQGTNSVPPNRVTISPDGHRLAIWGTNKIIIEDLPNGRTHTLRETPGASGGYNSVAFSPDSTTLAIATSNAGIALVRLADNGTSGTLEQGDVDAVTFSPDGKSLTYFVNPNTGSRGHIVIHNLATGATKSLDSPASELPQNLTYSPDGSKLATSVLYGPTLLTDLTTGTTTTISEGLGQSAASFSPDGTILARGTHTGVIIYHLDTGRTNTVADGSAADSVAFSSDGKTLAWGDATGAILDDLSTGNTTTLGDGSRIESLVYAPDGNTLITGNDAGQINTWDLHRLAEATFNGQSPATSIAFSRDGRLLASGNSDGTVTIENLNKNTSSIVDVNAPVIAIAFNPEGTTLAVVAAYPGGFIGKTELVNLATQQATTIADPSDVALSLAFSPDATHLAVGYIEDPAFYDLSNVSFKTIVVPGGASSLAYSHNGGLIAIGTFEGFTLYDPASGTIANLINGPRVNSVAFNSTDTTVAVGQADGTIVLLDTTTHTRRTIDDGFPVNSVAISPDNATLASGDSNGQIVLVNLATGTKVALNDQYPIRGLAFNPAGTELATLNDSGQIHLYDATAWTLDFNAQRARLCQQLGNANLSRAQWSLYLPSISYHQICP
jgi:WD40 repeat protein